MFVHLHKKIGLSSGAPLQSVLWSGHNGWIACGGTEGNLKMMKVETEESDHTIKLGANQKMEGHRGNITKIVYNHQFNKITTADENGTIVVWILHRDKWFEEMINNRNESNVADMRWTKDGKRICIAYADGYVIVGSTDGNREWFKEFKTKMRLTEWAPSGKYIVFVNGDNKVSLHDSKGNEMFEITVLCQDEESTANIADIAWHAGNGDSSVPCFAIAFDNGRMQLMRDYNDKSPILLDADMIIRCIRWNPSGTCLAVVGKKKLPDNGVMVHFIQFFDNFGNSIYTLQVPVKTSDGISDCCWEPSGSRLAITVDSYIYFAVVKSEYQFCYFGNGTLCYSMERSETSNFLVYFWDTIQCKVRTKDISKLYGIAGCPNGEYALVACQSDSDSEKADLSLCNAIGKSEFNKSIDFIPSLFAVSSNFAVAASSALIFLWQHTHDEKLIDIAGNLSEHSLLSKIIHIDELATKSSRNRTDKPEFDMTQDSSDPITAITARKNSVVIARRSGHIICYSMLQDTIEFQIRTELRVSKLGINCDVTRLSTVDPNGHLLVFQCRKNTASDQSAGLDTITVNETDRVIDRRDVWDLQWADDDPECIATMEKSKLYIYRNNAAEDPIVSCSNLCQFKKLQITAIAIETVFASADKPKAETITHFQSKLLRTVKQLLVSSPLSEVVTYVQSNPHQQLWEIVAEHSLNALQLNVAQNAFQKSKDYRGIQFVKRLKKLNSKHKQKAEVLSYFGKYDQSEKIYLELNEKNLALNLRQSLGDWSRVLELIQLGAGDDKTLQSAYRSIAEHYQYRMDFSTAVKYFAKAKDYPSLARCAYRANDFAMVHSLVRQLPTGSQLLKSIGEMLRTVGMCKESVSAYVKFGDIKSAIDCAVFLQRWDIAAEIAIEHGCLDDVRVLVTKKVSDLMGNNQIFDAVYVLHKATQHLDAAKLITRHASKIQRLQRNDPILLKKLYVLSAMEMDKYRIALLRNQKNGANYKSAMDRVDLLLEMDRNSDAKESTVLNSSWHGAEAYHFYTLAQRQIHSNNLSNALLTCHHLTNYDDILSAVDIYSMLAYVAYNTQHFEECSKAMTQLECIHTSELVKQKYRKLAVKIFTKNERKNPLQSILSETVPFKMGEIINVCMATGAIINRSDSVVICQTCHHKTLQQSIIDLQLENCPLCHTQLSANVAKQ